VGAGVCCLSRSCYVLLPVRPAALVDYTIGGGSITAGPVRSRTLAAGSWELTPRAPMAAPAAAMSAAGLAPTDAKVFRGFYQEVWARETPANKEFIAAYLANITAWNWGVSRGARLRSPTHCNHVRVCLCASSDIRLFTSG
jgi:hypothetical protein